MASPCPRFALSVRGYHGTDRIRSDAKVRLVFDKAAEGNPTAASGWRTEIRKIQASPGLARLVQMTCARLCIRREPDCLSVGSLASSPASEARGARPEADPPLQCSEIHRCGRR